jgi:hypothetical protein
MGIKDYIKELKRKALNKYNKTFNYDRYYRDDNKGDIGLKRQKHYEGWEYNEDGTGGKKSRKSRRFRKTKRSRKTRRR